MNLINRNSIRYVQTKILISTQEACIGARTRTSRGPCAHTAPGDGVERPGVLALPPMAPGWPDLFRLELPDPAWLTARVTRAQSRPAESAVPSGTMPDREGHGATQLRAQCEINIRRVDLLSPYIGLSRRCERAADMTPVTDENIQ